MRCHGYIHTPHRTRQLLGSKPLHTQDPFCLRGGEGEGGGGGGGEGRGGGGEGRGGGGRGRGGATDTRNTRVQSCPVYPRCCPLTQLHHVAISLG